MSSMIVLIDTNIILDHFISRAPYMDSAGAVFQYCFQGKCCGYVAAHSITNIFYILRKQFSTAERKRILLGLCDFIEIAGVQKFQLIDALNDETFDDLEDCLQAECAKTVNADYIMSLFQNSVSFDRLMQFLRLKPYETALFKGCCSKT